MLVGGEVSMPRRSSCGTLKQVNAEFKRAVREAVRLAGRGEKWRAEQMLTQAHGKVYWCARHEGYADVRDWQSKRRRRRRSSEGLSRVYQVRRRQRRR
jgi:hypothetical protein